MFSSLESFRLLRSDLSDLVFFMIPLLILSEVSFAFMVTIDRDFDIIPVTLVVTGSLDFGSEDPTSSTGGCGRSRTLGCCCLALLFEV